MKTTICCSQIIKKLFEKGKLKNVISFEHGDLLESDYDIQMQVSSRSGLVRKMELKPSLKVDDRQQYS